MMNDACQIVKVSGQALVDVTKHDDFRHEDFLETLAARRLHALFYLNFLARAHHA
jgi:hypothetical protein